MARVRVGVRRIKSGVEVDLNKLPNFNAEGPIILTKLGVDLNVVRRRVMDVISGHGYVRAKTEPVLNARPECPYASTDPRAEGWEHGLADGLEWPTRTMRW